MLRSSLATAVVLFFALTAGTGQTCCSGGVPLSSNLGLPPSEGRTLQVNLTYDLNVLETLKSGTRVLDDASRSRRTHSVLLELGYSFSDRFSVDAFFSYVRQERAINQNGLEDFDQTAGPGDAVLLFKYRIFGGTLSGQELRAALGIKAPLGSSDKTDERGIPYNADLQPGSGAWDGIFWAQYTRALGFRPSMNLAVTATYSLKGKNRSYLGSSSYQFGQEFFLIAGVSDRVSIFGAIVDPSLSFRFRTVDQDRFDEGKVPGTGGKWVFVNPAASYWLNDRLSLNAGIELPLLADIVDTQVTPTYRINAGIYYHFQVGQKRDFHRINF